MENKEKNAIQRCLLSLLDDLDPTDVTPHLFQNDFLTCEQYEELSELQLPRRKLCRKFLSIITSDSSVCSFQGLLAALNYKQVYQFLANKLIDALQQENEYFGSTQTGTGHFQPHGQSHDTLSRANRIRDAGEEASQKLRLSAPIQKIDVFKENRTKMSRLAHKLKTLSHNGDMDKFRRYVSNINKKFEKDKLDASRDIEARMELADMKFIALEAEASSKRVKYDVTLYGNPLFDAMESIIPFTSNPRVSSMTYLARYGSSVSMLESLENGLAILQYSKHHAEHIVPCKETGMVYYIEVNLLSQKYEQQPDTELKTKILKTAELAISQFADESETVQVDYQRMLMLKMAFCRLGIGLFGNQISNVVPEESDTDAAKEYLDYIENKHVWHGMEKRRKMLFLVAKSELYRQRHQFDLALPHAKEAVKLATENQWKAELPNLQRRLEEIECEGIRPTQTLAHETDDIEDWLNGLGGDDDDEENEGFGRIESLGDRNLMQPEMELLKGNEQFESPNGGTYPVRMKNLKRGEDPDSLIQMQTLKQHNDIRHTNVNTGSLEMEFLKHDQRSDMRSVTDMDILKQQGNVEQTNPHCKTISNEVHNVNGIMSEMMLPKHANEVEYSSKREVTVIYQRPADHQRMSEKKTDNYNLGIDEYGTFDHLETQRQNDYEHDTNSLKMPDIGNPSLHSFDESTEPEGFIVTEKHSAQENGSFTFGHMTTKQQNSNNIDMNSLKMPDIGNSIPDCTGDNSEIQDYSVTEKYGVQESGSDLAESGQSFGVMSCGVEIGNMDLLKLGVTDQALSPEREQSIGHSYATDAMYSDSTEILNDEQQKMCELNFNGRSTSVPVTMDADFKCISAHGC